MAFQLTNKLLSVIPALRTLRQDVQESEVILSYLVSWKLPWATYDPASKLSKGASMFQTTMGQSYINRLLGISEALMQPHLLIFFPPTGSCFSALLSGAESILPRSCYRDCIAEGQ